jgi:hypothetical protein
MPVLTPKVIMYTVGPPGYEYPLYISSTLSLYSLINTLCLLHLQHLQVGCISLISCTSMAAQHSIWAGVQVGWMAIASEGKGTRGKMARMEVRK